MTTGLDSILAIDAATRLGWAHLDVDGSLAWGSHMLRASDQEEAADVCAAALAWAHATIVELKPALLAIERPFAGGAGRVGSDLLLGGIYGCIVGTARRFKLPIVAIAPATLKKFATGSGKASKGDMILAIRAQGFDVKLSDETDAVALALMMAQAHGLRVRQPGQPKGEPHDVAVA